MNISIEHFKPWVKTTDRPVQRTSSKVAVVYTRVSSKEQFDKNLSLDWQKKTIEDFGIRNSFTLDEYFGGTFESAKTDGRKEFMRMLEYIKRRRGKITHILVYLLDRFSRTGGGAIALAKELREKYGVTIVAVTQPIDTSNPGGVFQQNMQFLFSEYDNQLRRQRAMAGIKEKLNRGIWCIKPPMGYDIIRTDGIKKIVVNTVGKKLKKAFEWKAKGMKNDEILQRLQAMGVKIYKQKLSAIFSNPFYCGIIVNKMLEGKIVEGLHEKLIPHELFLRVNEIRIEAKGKYGITHKKEIEETPLKLFAKCDKCQKPLTGYVVKKKGLHYYKCRTVGCKCNKNAKKLNQFFAEHLSDYTLLPHLVLPLKEVIYTRLEEHTTEMQQQADGLKKRLAGIRKSMEQLEERYYLHNEIPEDIYSRLNDKLSQEKLQTENLLAQTPADSSNLKQCFDLTVHFSLKLNTGWDSAGFHQKEKLQKLVFPSGIYYDFKNETFRTKQVNQWFSCIPRLNRISEDDPNKKGSISAALSCLVGTTRFGNN